MNLPLRSLLFSALMALILTGIARADFVVQNLQNFRYGITNPPATKSPPDKKALAVPVVEFEDVPFSKAVYGLAHVEGINYFFDPAVYPFKDSDGNTLPDPTINLKVKNVGPKYILKQLLHEHQLILIEDPVSTIAIVTGPSQITNTLFAGHRDAAAEGLISHTNDVPPHIQFEDVPLSTGIDSLARLSQVNYILDTNLAFNRDLQGNVIQEPPLNFRLDNVSGWNSLNRILDLYGLELTEFPGTGVACISRGQKSFITVDISLLSENINVSPAVDTVIPRIEASDAPLDDVLKGLIQKASLPVTLDSRITGDIDPRAGWLPEMPNVTIRWEGLTVPQAIAALCENFKLVIVKHPATGMIKIEPAPRRKK